MTNDKLADEIAAYRRRHKGDMLVSVPLTDEQWASVEGALRAKRLRSGDGLISKIFMAFGITDYPMNREMMRELLRSARDVVDDAKAIAALRAERPQPGEMVMPRDVLEDIYSLAACDNHCGSNDCPFCSIGNEIRALFADRKEKAMTDPAQPVEATPETDARVPICGTAGLTVPRVIWDEAMIAYQKTYGKDQRQYVRLLREGFYAEELDQLRPGWRPVAQRIADLERQLSLAQTENAGHIRIEDELKAALREAEKR